MSTKPNYVQLPRTVDQSALDLLKEEAKDKVLNGYYKPTSQGGYYCHPAAAETQSFNNPDTFISYIEGMAVKGIKRYPHIEPILQPGLYQITYFKPEEELTALIQQAEQEAEQTYKDGIDSFNQAQTDLLTNQLVEAELKKEQKREDDRIAAIRAKATATAQAHIAQQLKEIK